MMTLQNTTYDKQLPQQQINVSQFEQVYTYTLSDLCGSTVPTNAPLQVLHLLLDCPQHQTVLTLRFWIFCKAQQIFASTEPTQIRQHIYTQIVRCFILQLTPEQQLSKHQEVRYLVYSILEQMGFVAEHN